MAAQMWRVVNVYRVITLGYAAVLIIRDDRDYAHPGAGLAVLAVMTGWSAVTVVAYRRPAGPVAVADRRRCRGGDDAGASAPAGSTTPPGSTQRLADAPGRLGGGLGPGLRGGGRTLVGPGRRNRRVRGGRHRARNVPDDEHLQRDRARAHRGRRRRVGGAARAAGRVDGRAGRPARGGAGRTGAARARTFTTPCCRCWRWSAAGAGPSAARRPRSGCWRASRKRRCAPCWPRATAGPRAPERTASSTCGR